MERIVYILGAGFSAPLGLPVMSNFIEKSKDIYFNYPDKYRYFMNIYKMIKEVSYLKNFINSDLHNIEEILSILEMGYFVSDNNKSIKRYKQFLKDVIEFYTPKPTIDRLKQNKHQWTDCCFGEDKKINLYGKFLSNLLQIKLCRVQDKRHPDFINYHSKLCDTPKDADYGVVTLNYDLVLENIVDFINMHYELKGSPVGLRLSLGKITSDNQFLVSKLHGSVDREVIPPTWNKSSANTNLIRISWRVAYEMLVSANQIRIIGYSLPVSDSYIKYLLSVALKNSQHLRMIDVITLDSDKHTEERYNKLFTYPKFRFKNANFLNFLESAYKGDEIKTTVTTKKDLMHEYSISEFHMHSSILEKAHDEFMR